MLFKQRTYNLLISFKHQTNFIKKQYISTLSKKKKSYTRITVAEYLEKNNHRDKFDKVIPIVWTKDKLADDKSNVLSSNERTQFF